MSDFSDSYSLFKKAMVKGDTQTAMRCLDEAIDTCPHDDFLPLLSEQRGNLARQTQGALHSAKTWLLGRSQRSL